MGGGGPGGGVTLAGGGLLERTKNGAGRGLARVPRDEKAGVHEQDPLEADRTVLDKGLPP